MAYQQKRRHMPNPVQPTTAARHALRCAMRKLEKMIRQFHDLLDAAEGMDQLPSDMPPLGLQYLTRTEREVWRRIADPKDEKYAAIYPTLGMSKRNFDKHVGRLFKKLGVHGRPGAVRLWVKFGKGREGG